MLTAREKASDVYKKHRHLKMAADEIGVPWQTLYVWLRQDNVAVTGDKSTYGSPKDKLACLGEMLFEKHVPDAKNHNDFEFQSKVDFDVFGYAVDVKTAKRKKTNKFHSKSWAFCLRKQSMDADFFVCYGLGPEKEIERIFLIPAEMVRGLQTISVPESMKSKWAQFLVDAEDLYEFFLALPKK